MYNVTEIDYTWYSFSCLCKHARCKFKSQLFIGIFLIGTDDAVCNLLS